MLVSAHVRLFMLQGIRGQVSGRTATKRMHVCRGRSMPRYLFGRQMAWIFLNESSRFATGLSVHIPLRFQSFREILSSPDHFFRYTTHPVGARADAV